MTRIMSETITSEMLTAMQELTEHGYKCYTTTKGNWGFIITPSDNVLYVQYETLPHGWNMSLQYKPSRDNGSGCQCLENAVGNLSLEVIEQAEKEGLQFAYKLRANLYKNSDAWLNSYWAKDSLTEV